MFCCVHVKLARTFLLPASIPNVRPPPWSGHNGPWDPHGGWHQNPAIFTTFLTMWPPCLFKIGISAILILSSKNKIHFPPIVSTTVRPLVVTSCVEPERTREVFLLRRLRDGSHPNLVIQVVLPRGPGPTWACNKEPLMPVLRSNTT